MSKLFFHLGAHRTASTAIQFTMDENEAALSAQNSKAFTPKKNRKPLFNRIISIANESKFGDQDEARQILSPVFESLGEGLNVIISEENFIGTMRQNFRTGGFYQNSQIVPKFLSEVFDREVEIVLSIRSYHEYYASAFSFLYGRVIQGDFDSYKQAILAQTRGWTEVVQELTQIQNVRKIHVLPMDFYKDNFQNFWSVFGLKNLPSSRGWAARSKHDLGVQKLQEAAKRGIDISDKLERAGIIDEVRKIPFKSFRPWKGDEFQMLQNHFEKDLMAISEISKVNLNSVSSAMEFDRKDK